MPSPRLVLACGRPLHVVLLSCPPPGHALPCSQLSRRLASRGVAVSLVSSDLHVQELHADAFLCSHPSVRLVGLGDGSACSSTTFWDMMRAQPQCESLFAGCLDVLLRHMRTPAAPWAPPCCVIADMFALGWCQDVVANHNLECHAFYPSPANALCFAIHLKRLIHQGRVPVTPSNQTEVITDIPGLPRLHPSDIPRSFFQDTPASDYNFTCRHFLRIATSSVVLVNSFEELEEVALHGLRTQAVNSEFVKTRSIYTVGLLCSSEDTEETQSVDAEVADETGVEIDEYGENEVNPYYRWLNTRASGSVLYVAFGSARSNLSTEQLFELAEGLEASAQPFLWVLRPPGVHSSALSSSSLNAVVELFPPGFLERVKDRALIYPGWAPQRDILAHPAVGGFLTHCGWNSSSESIVAGVPMLVWPLGAEQRITARFLVDTAKLAFECHNGCGALRKATDIEKLVKKLLKDTEGAEVRSKVAEMQKLATRAATDSSKEFNIIGYVKELRRLANK